MPSDFVATWERVYNGIKGTDPDLTQSYNTSLVTANMVPLASTTRDASKTFVTQQELGIAFDPHIDNNITLTPGSAAAANITAAAASTVIPPDGDGLSPLYLVRTDVVPGNLGPALITAIGAASDATISYVVGTLLGVIPPAPATLAPVTKGFWDAQAVFSLQSHQFDASIIRYITGGFYGGEG